MTDRELIDSNQWNKIHDKYKNYILTICTVDKPNGAHFENRYDISQEAWVKIWQKIDQFLTSDNDDFSRWISVIAKNTKLDWLRSNGQTACLNNYSAAKKKYVKPLPLFSAIDENSLSESLFENFDHSVDNTEMVNKILKEVNNLIPSQKDVFMLRLKYSFNKIKSIVGVNINTALSRQRYAIRAIKKALQVAAILFIFIIPAKAQLFSDSMDAVNFHPVWNPADTNTVAPTVYLYPTFVTAKCKIIVKDCSNCRQRVINCYRKSTDSVTNIFYTNQALSKKIVFRSGWWWRIWKQELYYFNWYDLNW